MAAAIVVIVGVDASRQAELAFDCKYITNFIFSDRITDLFICFVYYA